MSSTVSIMPARSSTSCGLAGREGHAAVAEQRGGHTMPAHGGERWIPADLGVQDEYAGRRNPGSPQDPWRRSPACPLPSTLPTAVIKPSSIAKSPGTGIRAGAVDEFAATDHDVMCHWVLLLCYVRRDSLPPRTRNRLPPTDISTSPSRCASLVLASMPPPRGPVLEDVQRLPRNRDSPVSFSRYGGRQSNWAPGSGLGAGLPQQLLQLRDATERLLAFALGCLKLTVGFGTFTISLRELLLRDLKHPDRFHVIGDDLRVARIPATQIAVQDELDRARRPGSSNHPRATLCNLSVARADQLEPGQAGIQRIEQPELRDTQRVVQRRLDRCARWSCRRPR